LTRRKVLASKTKLQTGDAPHSQHGRRVVRDHCELSKGTVSISSQFCCFWKLRRNRNEIARQKTRSNSQLLRSASPHVRRNLSMKIPVMLLLTNDSELEDSVAEALLQLGGVSHLSRHAGDALETVCGVHDLDLAVIDFEHGPHGMTLLGAINACREGLPVIAITREDDKRFEALAYANGATACFSKPVSATQLAVAIRELCGRKLEPAFA
jgi:CheY-like chemotaxis protein